MKNLQIFINDIKREVLFHIIMDMRDNKLTISDAKDLATDFLSIFPVTDIKDLIYQLQLLGDLYHSIRLVFIKYANEYYDEEKEDILSKIPNYIHTGQINGAIQILRGGVYHA